MRTEELVFDSDEEQMMRKEDGVGDTLAEEEEDFNDSRLSFSIAEVFVDVNDR